MSDIALSAGRRTMVAVEKAFQTGRLFEWIMAGMMIAVAITLTLWPKSAEAASLRILIEAGFSEEFLRLGFFGGGLARCAALYANGHWPVIGPWLRAIGALGGAILWALMASAVAPSLGEIGTGALAVAVFGSLFVGEIFSCHRSLAHGRWWK